MQHVAVVTGANKGIGYATVKALLSKFKGVVYLTARDQEKGNEAVHALKKMGLDPKFHLLDISDTKSIGTLKEYLVRQYGGVDVFIHNAGIMMTNSNPMTFGNVAKTTMATNYYSMVNVCNSILPIMKSNGRLVILSSVLSMPSLQACSKENQDFFKSANLTEQALTKKMSDFVEAARNGTHGRQGFSNDAYGMSKLGVNAFTRILAKRARALEAKNVLVNCCCPGWVKTDMGGPGAHLTPEQGAEIPTMLALIPEKDSQPNGEFVRNNKVFQWY